MRGHRFLVVVLVAGALAACDDKASGAAADAGGDVAALAKASGGNLEAGAQADAGVDETAMPAAAGEELSGRMRHLLEAVAQNNPDLAGDVLFPREAYGASKDLPDPHKAWEKRVSGAFKRAVERTHKRTKGIENAKFVSFELGRSIVQLTPRKKDFKKPLWRVKHSRLTFSLDGKTRQLDVAEMTAWRGNWYVTRLR
jgi:hypothetical protein